MIRGWRALHGRRSCSVVCCAVCKCSIKKISNFFCVICICTTAISDDPWPYYKPVWHFDGAMAINTSMLGYVRFFGGHPGCLSSLAHNCFLCSTAKVSLSFVHLSAEINCNPKVHRQTRDVRHSNQFSPAYLVCLKFQQDDAPQPVY